MTRAVFVLWYYLSWQRLMIYISAAGLALLAAGLLLTSGGLRIMLTGVGCFVAVTFSLLLGGIAFRQLVGNRRLALVPHFREHAVIALAALAALGALVIFSFVINLPEGNEFPAQLKSFPALFALISTYLLLSQWLVAYSPGLLGFAFLPLVILRLMDWFEPVLAEPFGNSWLITTLTIGGWIWLYLAMRISTGSVRGLASPAWAGAAGTSNLSQPMPPPAIGRPGSAAGTLMRGGNDGWIARLSALLRFPVAMPVLVIGVFLLMGMPLRAPQVPKAALLISFYGIALSMFFMPAEWPARVRYLWLRTAGDRQSFWRTIERDLLGDTLIITGTTALFAAVVHVLGDVPYDLLALYVAACVVTTLLSAYCGFWFRISQWRSLPQMAYIVALTILVFVVLVMIQMNESAMSLIALIATLLALAFVIRLLARQGFHQIDWCAIRPVRGTPRPQNLVSRDDRSAHR